MKACVFVSALCLAGVTARAQDVTAEDFQRLDRAAEIVHQQRLEQLGLLGAYRGLQGPRAFPPPGPPYSLLRPAPIPAGPVPPVAAAPAVQLPPEVKHLEDELNLDEPLAPAAAGNFSDEEPAESRRLRESLLAYLAAKLRLDLPDVRRLANRLAELTPAELRALDQARELRQERDKQELSLREKEVLSEAKLNLQRAEAFRDYLQREFQFEVLDAHRQTEALGRASLLFNAGAAFSAPYPAYPAPAFAYPPVVPPGPPFLPW
jgi:hypothetical protein